MAYHALTHTYTMVVRVMEFQICGYKMQQSAPRCSRGSVPSSHARGQRFEPQSRQYLFQVDGVCPGLGLLQPQWNPYLTLTLPS